MNQISPGRFLNGFGIFGPSLIQPRSFRTQLLRLQDLEIRFAQTTSIYSHGSVKHGVVGVSRHFKAPTLLGSSKESIVTHLNVFRARFTVITTSYIHVACSLRFHASRNVLILIFINENSLRKFVV